MTLADLIRRFRTLAKDVAQPYRAEDEDVIDWLNDAQAQACVRGRLLVAEGDAGLCHIPLTMGQTAYQLHRAVYELIHLQLRSATGCTRPVVLKSREWLEAEVQGWRNYPRPVCMAIQTDTGLRMVGQVEDGDVLELEGYRLPMDSMAAPADPEDPQAVWPSPEIHEAHHEHLVQWALHKAFSVPDSELFDPERSVLSERAFTDYFGILPDSGMRRETRQDVQHYVRGYMA